MSDTQKPELMDIQYLSRIELGGVVKAGLTPQGDKTKDELVVEIPVTQEKLKLSEEEMKAWLEKEIQSISPNRQFRIDTIMPAFSMHGDMPKSEFNTMVLLNTPYVFYLPDYFVINLTHPLECRVKFIKQWTARVKDSNRLNAVSGKRLYFRNFDLKTPMLPLDVTSGPNIGFTGKNIEKDGDNSGEYRYSTLLVELDTNLSDEDIKDTKLVLEKVKALVIDVVFYLTKIYKYCAKDFSIRFNPPIIVEIFFPERNLGFYVIDGALIRDATINNAKHEIEQFEQLSEEGFEPTLDLILLMDAKSAFLAQEYKLAILEAFQAMDVFLETFMRAGFEKKGLDASAVEQKLENTWKTRERVEKLLIDLCGKGLSQIDGKCGSDWHNMYENVRNVMIHKGYQPSRDDALKAVNLNEAAIEIIRKQNIL